MVSPAPRLFEPARACPRTRAAASRAQKQFHLGILESVPSRATQKKAPARPRVVNSAHESTETPAVFERLRLRLVKNKSLPTAIFSRNPFECARWTPDARGRVDENRCSREECDVQKKGDRYLVVDPWRIVEKG